MNRYKIQIVEYTSKRRQYFAAVIRCEGGAGMNEPGFKTREAAQEWAERTIQENGPRLRFIS